jgi:hypothetical protein
MASPAHYLKFYDELGVLRIRPAASRVHFRALKHPMLMLAAMASFGLSACTSAPRPAPAPPPPPAPPPLDASYDWHVLLTARFGSLLKDVPFTLHEVLLFKDQAHSAAAPDEGDCFAIDGTPPRFLDKTPDQYLMCFKNDRLSRIQTTVRLKSTEAAQIFADACGLWLKNALNASGAPAPAAASGPDACQGTSSAISFSARLEENPDHTDSVMSVKLDATDR